MGKKIIACLLAVFMLCGSVSALAAPPKLESPSACLMDAETGQILYELDAQTERPMASITKTMTALLIMENGDLSASTVATAEAINSVELDSTRVGFEPNEQLTVDELMYCMLVYSANDAANILACYLDGNVQAFVDRMNAKAQELGCTHTHFANPNGLDADGHYSCAEDMARITYAANQYPEFAKYSGTVYYELPADNIISAGWQIWTKVDMLRKDSPTYDARIYAAKTGWTTNAHNTFVACGRSDQADLIVSVLGCPVKNGIFTDTAALLNYGEQAYQKLTVTVDDYKKAAKKAAKKADCKLDTNGLADFTLRLPAGMDADDLEYTCETTETGAQLAVTIAEGSRKEYAAVTGMDGTQPLLRVPLTLKNAEPETTGSAVGSAEDSAEPQIGVMELMHGAETIAVVVAGAVVLMLVLLLLLGLYRRIRRKK
ncbi:D-alanyl-D-alanine carboxypeptidase family protein [Butyricicoccus sp.]|uniref:D-alanyl-D-alanine carboxypeptidase family protein n=1 Tax=Butyricicoccus sp. TaxID=2049021 RepID=UPI003735C551